MQCGVPVCADKPLSLAFDELTSHGRGLCVQFSLHANLSCLHTGEVVYVSLTGGRVLSPVSWAF
jgi:hypothetical protein